MIADVYSKENEKVGQVNLPDFVFARKWNDDLVHQVLSAQLANRRRNLAHTKGRGEVRGGGKKPWRQKGTGRARHGSIRSPIWIGGGVTHGPTKEKIYAKKINKKMRRAAIFAVLTRKLEEGFLKFVDSLELDSPKSRLFAALLKKIGGGAKSALVIPSVGSKNIYRAAANVPGALALDPRSLNVYDLLRYQLVLMDKNAVETIEQHYKI